MKKWQYDYRKIGSGSLLNMDHMNDLGKNGWELTSVVALPQATIYYFKKEIMEKAEPIDVD